MVSRCVRLHERKRCLLLPLERMNGHVLGCLPRALLLCMSLRWPRLLLAYVQLAPPLPCWMGVQVPLLLLLRLPLPSLQLVLECGRVVHQPSRSLRPPDMARHPLLRLHLPLQAL